MENNFTFPKYFLWGAATSSHQVEGNNMNNDWSEWEQNGKVKERSGKACDHWNRFREDFELAKSLHHNAHRFSLEWSRIEPEEGTFSDEALSHYRDVIQALKSNGLEPIITLHHFTLPLWLAQKGGWLAKETPEIFARYVQNAVETIGDGVQYWLTLNEPVAYVFKSYLAGEWPP
ncbi:MAG: glycoside hydrolase family 1 protein, partial [Candidatus Omnitrophica bacterium]|nr:glycoside hydrolase family 1 protein [Candidatus Omnitrophota bacterium]